MIELRVCIDVDDLDKAITFYSTGLGLTPGRITPLHVMAEPVHLPDGEPASPEFAQRLMELLGKDQKDKS